LRALGYVAPAEQSTGANGVSEADERLAKGGTAVLNEVKGTSWDFVFAQRKSFLNAKKIRQSDFVHLYLNHD